LVKAAYMTYFTRVLPLVGRWVSGHPWAYTYLPASVKGFPGPEELAGMMREAGFREPGFRLLSLGIAAIHWGIR
jgi:demethylmenaquinone methyltransferase/2-methoxy-6-polyprenyl-1,4-benzoquinol methylase